MKFDRIEIDAFGALQRTQVERLGGRLNVVYGPNGAGKTTLMQFVRGLFCGYGPARKLGLLPASGDTPGGGTIEVRWQGDTCRFRRQVNGDSDDALRITRNRNGLQTALPGLDAGGLPTDPIQLLFTAATTDVHAVSKLVQLAVHDGIDLVTPQTVLQRQTAAAARHQAEQSERAEVVRNRIAQLSERRQCLLSEWQQLKAQHDERVRIVREQHRERHADEALGWRLRIDWLHAELQAAESDLREAEDRAWRRDDRRRMFPRKQAPLLRLRRAPAMDHIEVSHRRELEDIDRRVGNARRQLEKIARDRLQVNLRAARIAGSPELPTDEFLSQLRRSLTAIEDALLELRDDADRLDAAAGRLECVCGAWSSAARTVVDDVRRRLYGTCDCVSLFELQYLNAQLIREANRLDREEQALRNELQALDERRQQLIASVGHIAASTGPAQAAASHELCRCSEHEPRGDVRTELRKAVALPPETEPLSALRDPRPAPEELSRLSQRRKALRGDLEAARVEWRKIRRRAEPLDLPIQVCALEQQTANKQLELESVEQDLSNLQHQERELAADAESPTAAVVAADLRPPCIRWAAAYLARLTAGRYCDLLVHPDRPEVQILDEHGTALSSGTISRGLLAQLALSMRLALVQAYAEKGIRFPLVLDDVLVECDTDRLQEAVRLLREFADMHDQQIVYLTCGSHVTRLFESAGACVRMLSAAQQPASLALGSANWSVQGWIDRRLPRATSVAGPAEEIGENRAQPAAPPDEARIAAAQRDAAQIEAGALFRRQPDGPYWLSAGSSLMHVPSIGEQMGRRLAALGIRTVSDLLHLTADESSIPLRTVQVDIGRLREWQAEAWLLSCVPDLAGPDAQLLVACGVSEPRMLAECNVAELIQRLDRLSRRNRESRLDASLPAREDLQRWIQSARRARSLDNSRGKVSRKPLRRGGEHVTHTLVPRRQRWPKPPHRGPASRAEDRAVMGRLVPAAVSASHGQSAELKFYLSPESPVVDAPSIGPKTASRLEKLGISTVNELLTSDPAVVAERLKSRRICADTVALWQRQARLMCRIPQLRGHDAQVLVACDITEPEQVAGMDARTLFGIVGPFAETTEGQRLLRSSKSPDLNEVADWIQRANQARPLRAA